MTTHFHVRDTRDRLTELLAIGLPYPLRDLPVRDEQLTVAFNTMARIPIEYSQPGVLYQLFLDGQPVERTETGEEGQGIPIAAEGNGGTLILETYKITDDITFEIRATKLQSGLETYLHETATVKVGLDVSLAARIINLPTLYSLLGPAEDTVPRIGDYGAVAEVEIVNSQEGVDYKLVYFTDPANEATETDLSETSVRGDLHNIILRSKPVPEDIDIHIRATKTFDPSENRPTQTQRLQVVLPLKVRANTGLAVSTTPIIAHDATATVTVAQTQRSVSYQLFTRPIPDSDFIRRDTEDALRVSVPGEPDVLVPYPPRGEIWEQPRDFVEAGAMLSGTGGSLNMPVGNLTHDSVVIVRATKVHQGDVVVESAVQLAQAVMVLVQPNVDQPLRISAVMEDGQTDGLLQVFDGQPGVFYAFRIGQNGNNLGLPAYFHQTDSINPMENKGIDQLAMQVDFVVARASSQSGNPALTPPESPIVETGVRSDGDEIFVHAMKAQTRVSALMNQTIHLHTLPDIHMENTMVDYGAFTRIIVTASVTGERYEPMLNGESMKRVRIGNGENLSFNTDPLTEDTEFEMHVTRPDAPGFPLTRIARLSVTVRPDNTMAVTPAETIITYNGTAEILVAASQSQIQYQLRAAGNPGGSTVMGNGSPIRFVVGPLAADTQFVVRASKTAAVFADLTQTSNVIVAPNAQIGISARDLTIHVGESTFIDLATTEKTVKYQLLFQGDPTGSIVTGTGSTISLNTGPLQGSTLVSVRATKANRSDVFVELHDKIDIQVLPNDPVPEDPKDPGPILKDPNDPDPLPEA